MTPDEIPTDIAKLIYTAPAVVADGGAGRKLSQNQAAKFLAHFWPAIEEHIRAQIDQETPAEHQLPPCGYEDCRC